MNIAFNQIFHFNNPNAVFSFWRKNLKIAAEIAKSSKEFGRGRFSWMKYSKIIFVLLQKLI